MPSLFSREVATSLSVTQSIPAYAPDNQQKSRHARRVSAAERREWLLFSLLVGPNIGLFCIFTYYPLLYSGYLSFVRWDMLAPVKRWVGLDNYYALFTAADFGQIMANTAIFTFTSVGLTCGLGLALALLLNQQLVGRHVVRSIVFSPVMLSGAAIGIVWIYILDPRYGLLDVFLRFAGLHSPNWLLDPHWAMPAVIMVYVWKNLGYAVVIYLAGLQAIPRELYEAALVDGAATWARFRHITIPGLAPVLFFLVLTTILAGFQTFDVIKVMTDGGPIDATTTLIYYLYQQGFVGFNAGRAGVAAVVLFGAMLAFTLIQMRYTERSVHYA
ncbi:sugar ABC transporter permease [soil metagenome]